MARNGLVYAMVALSLMAGVGFVLGIMVTQIVIAVVTSLH